MKRLVSWLQALHSPQTIYYTTGDITCPKYLKYGVSLIYLKEMLKGH